MKEVCTINNCFTVMLDDAPIRDFLPYFQQSEEIEMAISTLLRKNKKQVMVTNIKKDELSIKDTFCLIIQRDQIEFFFSVQSKKCQILLDLDQVEFFVDRKKESISTVKVFFDYMNTVIREVNENRAIVYTV